ncbi:MFS transporter [Aristophania vespae]|uniref:MFS transporter n=1 Tax=Aristophania vespae TaxID=2697033 RepID=UPI002351A841|nr:MFS transporter [Aristophania vespae]UMM64570.1 Inner membrane transport protein YdhP [Aristophania vespae]
MDAAITHDAVERVRPLHGVKPALTALAIGTFAVGAGEFGIMSILPAFAHSLNLTIEQATPVISSYALGVVIGAPVLAVAGAKLSRRSMVLALLCLFIIGNIATILCTQLPYIEAMRFITGLPHGAFFGIAALIGASLVDHAHRGRAIGFVFSGIMLSTLIGAPAFGVASQYVSWRIIYGFIAFLGFICILSVLYYIPKDKPHPDINPLSELDALKSGQVWLTLLTGAIGFGGLFGVYTFLTSALAEVTHLNHWIISIYQVIYGLGLVAGNAFGSIMVDRNLNKTVLIALIASIIFMIGFWLTLPYAWLALIFCFLLPAACIMLSPALQTRLMDVAGEAQTLAAALNHSAFNMANALGPWIAAQLIESGFGLGSVGWGGALLSAGGLLIYLVAMYLMKRSAAH